MSRPARAAGAARGGLDGLLLAGLLLVALNLRAPLTSLPPVVGEVAADLHLDAAAAGLLTGIPVLCFALATPAVAGLLGRVSLHRAVLGAMALVLAGTVVRSLDGAPVAFAGTVLLGLGITAGNVAVPLVAQRDFPTRAATVTGLYTAAMNVGTVATTALTAPLADLVGWRLALAVWGVLAVVAIVVWGLAVRRHDDRPRPTTAPVAVPDAPGDGATSSAPPPRPVLRTGFTWMLGATFALQSATYYALTAWMPGILTELAGVPARSGGSAAALFQGWAILGGVAVPVALRRLSVRTVFAGVAVCWLVLPLGLLLAPGGWMVWTSAAGVAQAANFVVIFTLVARRFPDVTRARRASATVQSLGYCLAAVMPTLYGALHTATSTWRAPVVLALVMLTAMTVLGLVLTGDARRRPAARG